MKKIIYRLLRGSFLTDETSFKNWRIILFIALLLLTMISSSHASDSKVIRIAELNKTKRNIRAKYIEISTHLMTMKMESNIKAKAKLQGLKPLKYSPQKIKVKNKN